MWHRSCRSASTSAPRWSSHRSWRPTGPEGSLPMAPPRASPPPAATPTTSPSCPACSRWVNISLFSWFILKYCEVPNYSFELNVCLSVRPDIFSFFFIIVRFRTIVLGCPSVCPMKNIFFFLWGSELYFWCVCLSVCPFVCLWYLHKLT